MTERTPERAFARDARTLAVWEYRPPEDLFWLPGHARVCGAAFMLENRDDPVGGEIKIAVRVGRVPATFESVQPQPHKSGAPARGRLPRRATPDPR